MDENTPADTNPVALLNITGSPALDGLIRKGISTAAGALATYFATQLGNNDPSFSAHLTAAIISLLAVGATMLWGYVENRIQQAVAVRAGMNLAVTGNARMMVTPSGAALTPAPVTTKSAAEIVKNFGTKSPIVPGVVTAALAAASASVLSQTKGVPQ